MLKMVSSFSPPTSFTRSAVFHKAFDPKVEKRALLALRQLCEEVLERCPEELQKKDAKMMTDPAFESLTYKEIGGLPVVSMMGPFSKDAPAKREERLYLLYAYNHIKDLQVFFTSVDWCE